MSGHCKEQLEIMIHFLGGGKTTSANKERSSACELDQMCRLGRYQYYSELELAELEGLWLPCTCQIDMTHELEGST